MRAALAVFVAWACRGGVGASGPSSPGPSAPAEERGEEPGGGGGLAGGPAAAERGGLDSLVGAWERDMEGFVPELLLTFPLAARSDEFFYEDIPDSNPILVRGAFFASAGDGEESTVEFSVTNPKGAVIFEKHGEAESLFHFYTDQAGTYTFIVSNHKWMQEKRVTLAVGKGNESSLKPEHLVTVQDHAKSIDKTLLDIQTESTYLWIRQQTNFKAVESIHTRVLAFCVVELVVLVGVSGFQAYYIKGLLSDRRIL